VKRYCEHTEAEVEILTEISRRDPKAEGHCVRMLDHFLHGELNYCIVFEPLDISLHNFLKANGSCGLLVADVRAIASQLLESLAFMHAIGLTHTDLKCRNVMLRDGACDVVPLPRSEEGASTRRLRRRDIAVIDFEEERHSGRIGTRQFRAPEVVLGLRWDETSDLWSAGCIFAMLYFGERAFSVHEDAEHLAMMEKFLGAPLPPAMALQAVAARCAPEGVGFSPSGRLRWPVDGAEEAARRVEAMAPLAERFRRRHAPLEALLRRLLDFDPRERLSASSARLHGLFTGGDLPE